MRQSRAFRVVIFCWPPDGARRGGWGGEEGGADRHPLRPRARIPGGCGSATQAALLGIPRREDKKKRYTTPNARPRGGERGRPPSLSRPPPPPLRPSLPPATPPRSLQRATGLPRWPRVAGVATETSTRLRGNFGPARQPRGASAARGQRRGAYVPPCAPRWPVRVGQGARPGPAGRGGPVAAVNEEGRGEGRHVVNVTRRGEGAASREGSLDGRAQAVLVLVMGWNGGGGGEGEERGGSTRNAAARVMPARPQLGRGSRGRVSAGRLPKRNTKTSKTRCDECAVAGRPDVERAARQSWRRQSQLRGATRVGRA